MRCSARTDDDSARHRNKECSEVFLDRIQVDVTQVRKSTDSVSKFCRGIWTKRDARRRSVERKCIWSCGSDSIDVDIFGEGWCSRPSYFVGCRDFDDIFVEVRLISQSDRTDGRALWIRRTIRSLFWSKSLLWSFVSWADHVLIQIRMKSALFVERM